MPTSGVERKRILLADDDDASRGSIISALGSRRFDYFEADCGRRAVEIALRQSLDLLFVDLQMPDISGLDVLRQIRRFDLALPCILISGACTEAVAAQALDEGANTMLDKPLNVEVVRTLVRTIMKLDRWDW